MARVLGHTFSYSDRSEKPREVCNLITRDARVPRFVLATGRPIYTCIYRNGVRPDVIYSVWQVVDILLSNAWADQCGNEDILARNISLPYAPKEKFIFLIHHKLCKRSWFSKPEVTSRHMKPAPLIHTIDSHSETHIRYLLALSNANCNARRASPQTSLLPVFFSYVFPFSCPSKFCINCRNICCGGRGGHVWPDQFLCKWAKTGRSSYK